MTDITIDTSALTDPQFVLPELGQQTIDGSTGAALSLPDGAYHVRHSTADPGGFAFSVAGGTLSFDPSFDGVAQGRGGTRLTLTGVTVTVDATQLDDSLRVSTYAGSPILRDQTQPLRLLPAAQYLISGTLAGADLGLTLDPQGGIELRPQDAGLATTAPGRLAITGLRISLDFTALDHDLYPLGFDNGGRFLSRSSVHELALLPAEGYGFQPGSGVVADFAYAVTRQGTVTVDPTAAGFARADGLALTITGYRVAVDGTALDHDLYPTGIAGAGQFLPRAAVNHLTVIPAEGYGFQPGAGVVADFAYAVTRQGTVTVDPTAAGFAHADGLALTIAGYRVAVDGTALDHDLYPTGIAGAGQFLPRATVNYLTVIPAEGYGFQPGAGVVADFAYAVTRQGTVTVDPAETGFAHTDGLALTITGYRVAVDGTALDHDLYPTGIAGAGQFLPRATVNHLTVIPAAGYGFQPGSGIVADFAYAVTRQGTVTIDPAFAGFAAAIDQTLLIQGYRMVLDATDADSSLVGIVQVPWPPQTPRTLEMTLIPCAGYVPRTNNGIFATGFTLGTDGTITVPPTATGYVVQQGTTPNPSQVNQEVSLRVSLQTDGDDEPPAAGLVTFTVSDRLIASTPVGPDGTAELTTTFDAPGSIEIVVGYTGDEHRLPSSLIVPHLVQ